MEWFILLAGTLGIASMGFLAGAITGVIYKGTWQHEFDKLHSKIDGILFAAEQNLKGQ